MLVGDEEEQDEEDGEAMIGLVPRHSFSANTRITRRYLALQRLQAHTEVLGP